MESDMNRILLAMCLSAGAMTSMANAQTVVYDGLNVGTGATFTSATPRTLMGQGFSITDPAATPLVSQIRVVMVAGGAVNYLASRLNLTLWDTYDATATGTALAFSNSLGTTTFNTGPVTTTGATALTFTLNFATPIALTGATGHGITFNWQSDAAGTGTFINNTLLTTALRAGTGGPPPALTVGANLNPSGGYFRNAAGLTTGNFQANDARAITNVGGLMFEITTVVPTPGAAALLGMGGLLAARRRRTA